MAAILFAALPVRAVNVTLAGDAFTQSSAPAGNKGKSKTLDVAGPPDVSVVKTSFLQFDLSTLPAGTTGANVSKATLTLFVKSVTASGVGSFDVVRVTSSWSESTLTAASAPTLGSTEQSEIPVDLSDVKHFKTVDVTQLVKDWIDLVLPNDGLALVANSGDGLNAKFQSKESTAQVPRLEITLIPDAVTTADLVDGSVTNPKLAADAVTSAKISDGTIATADLADESVTNPKLGADAVTSDKISDGTIATADLADGSVTNPKLGADAVTTDKISDGAVATADLANGSVTNLKLGPSSVTSDKIFDGTIGGFDVAANSLNGGHIIDGSLSGNDIQDGSLTGNDIADNSITSNDIQDNSVTTTDIQDNTIKSNDILDGSITASDIDINSVQVRVGGTCGTGDAIRAIGNNGAVICETSFLNNCALYTNGTAATGGTSCPDTDGVGEAWNGGLGECTLSCPSGKVLVSGGGRCLGNTWLASSFTYGGGTLWEVGCIDGFGNRSAPGYYSVYCCNN